MTCTTVCFASILEIHALTIQGIYPCAGDFRDALTLVTITDTDHKPAHASQVRLDIIDMLDWLYRDPGSKNPLQKAVYVLWKINHIHPFNGGNGRVARAVAGCNGCVQGVVIGEGPTKSDMGRTPKK